MTTAPKKTYQWKNFGGFAVVVLVYIAIAIMWAIHSDKVDLEHGAGLVAAFTSFAGTLWIMLGVWLSHDQILALNKLPTKSPKLVTQMKGLFFEAHHQLSIGVLFLGFGLVAQVVSVLAAINKW